MILLDVNSQKHAVESGPDTPLLYVLPNNLGPKGAKFGRGPRATPTA